MNNWSISYSKSCPDQQKNMEKETETEAGRETHLDNIHLVILSFQF